MIASSLDAAALLAEALVGVWAKAEAAVSIAAKAMVIRRAEAGTRSRVVIVWFVVQGFLSCGSNVYRRVLAGIIVNVDFARRIRTTEFTGSTNHPVAKKRIFD